jgi:pimeloyl-ACP methyl ester carboxylesterase
LCLKDPINNSNICNNNYLKDIRNISEVSEKFGTACVLADILATNVPVVINNQNNVNSSSGNSSSNQSLKVSKLKFGNNLDTALFYYNALIEYESQRNELEISKYKQNLTKILIEEYNISSENILNFTRAYEFNNSKISISSNDSLLTDLNSLNSICKSIIGTNKIINDTPNIVNIFVAMPAFKNNSILSFDETMQLQYANSDPRFEISIPQTPIPVPQCCVYSKCQSCEKMQSKRPLILLHGHSFNMDSTAYQSIEIFNNLEQKFSDDQVYYETGVLVGSDNITQNILGHYSIPIVTKSTYYIESYYDLLGLTVSESKNGNIDTYTLRLKESIDNTLYLTGSDKVDIVAHSMGGLVVRRYMQIFGTDKIGTVILVGTPNNGVDDKVYNLCKLFGSTNECEDMHVGGLFIRKLNDLSSQPKFDNMYLVIGKGCDTSNVDGDGVVSVNSSLINGPNGLLSGHILYVNGTCTGSSLLHNEMLTSKKYPQVYQFIKEKLAENNN